MVGYGGSGRQSICKLANFIQGSNLFRIQLKKNYKESNFKEDLLELYEKWLISNKTVFLLEQSQLVEEGFLEFINTMLTVGILNVLFDEQKKSEIKNTIRDECARAGKGETGEEIWEYYQEKVINNLNIVLCMSPAGDTLSRSCRNFPGIVSSSNIDWFYAWPEEALKAVAIHFLGQF